MNSDIKDVEIRLEALKKQVSTVDEELFNLGVELGRILEKKNIETHRPSLFINQENERAAYESKAKQIERAENVVEFLIKNAIAEQVEQYGAFCFDSNTYRSEKLEASIVEKYGVQIDRTTQLEHGGSFEADFILSGEIADALKKYEIDPYARADVDNSSGDEQETIYDADDVQRIFGVSLHINGHYTDLSVGQLTSLADELEKIQSWLSLSLKKPR